MLADSLKQEDNKNKTTKSNKLYPNIFIGNIYEHQAQ